MERKLVLTFTLKLVLPLVVTLTCHENQFESNDTECCRKCDAGHGLVKKCSNNNETQCEPCIPGETYSSSVPHSRSCSKCTKCKMNQHHVKICNTTHDTKCECNIDFYFNVEKEECSLCKMCPSGYGARRLCKGLHDTICSACGNGTFSDHKSAMSSCKECSKCSQGQTVLYPCSVFRDTACIYPITTSTTSGDRVQIPTESKEENFDVIPIYCAVLGAVIVGLLGYVMFKHYTRMRDKKRCKGHDPHEDVEYSKTSGADSGVFVETGEHHQIKSYNQLTRIRDIHPNKRKEIEKHLAVKRLNGEDWKLLAKELGYTCRKIDSISNRHKDTLLRVEHLLSDWSKNRHSTIGVFIKALLDIGRPDIVKILQTEIGEGKLEHGPQIV